MEPDKHETHDDYETKPIASWNGMVYIISENVRDVRSASSCFGTTTRILLLETTTAVTVTTTTTRRRSIPRNNDHHRFHCHRHKQNKQNTLIGIIEGPVLVVVRRIAATTATSSTLTSTLQLFFVPKERLKRERQRETLLRYKKEFCARGEKTYGWPHFSKTLGGTLVSHSYDANQHIYTHTHTHMYHLSRFVCLREFKYVSVFGFERVRSRNVGLTGALTKWRKE